MAEVNALSLSTLDIILLAAVGVLLLLTIMFAALYFHARSAAGNNNKSERALQEAQAAVRRLEQELSALQAQKLSETQSLNNQISQLRTQLGGVDVRPPEATLDTQLVAPVSSDSPASETEATLFHNINIGAPSGQARAPQSGLPYLEISSGIDKGKRYTIGPHEKKTIGRSSASDIVLADPGASRLHAEIFFAGGHFHLRDNQSKNHTFCNDEEITETVLQLGDKICFASTETVFSVPGFELMQTDPQAAIKALEQTLKSCPDFIPALRTMAFLLERDVARHAEAQAIWAHLKAVEKG